MKLLLTSVPFFLLLSFSQAQPISKKTTDEVLANGKSIYRLENATVFSSQMLQQKNRYSEVEDNLSYFSGKKTVCIFYKKENDAAKILYTIAYSDSINLNDADFSDVERVPDAHESILIGTKEKVNQRLLTDTMFKAYNNITFAIDMLETATAIDAYIMSVTAIAGRIIIGNDYLLHCDKTGKLLSEQRLQRKLLPVNVRDQQTSGGRITNFINAFDVYPPYIPPTAIAQLLLNNADEYWQDFVYNTDQYVSVFNLENNTLVIVEKQKYEK